MLYFDNEIYFSEETSQSEPEAKPVEVSRTEDEDSPSFADSDDNISFLELQSDVVADLLKFNNGDSVIVEKRVLKNMISTLLGKC